MVAQHPGAIGFPFFQQKMDHRFQGFNQQAVAVETLVVLPGLQDVENPVNVHDIDPVNRHFLRRQVKGSLHLGAFLQNICQQIIENPVWGGVGSRRFNRFPGIGR